ncbi:unnamed protein product [Rotaria sp. Silwood1]|nr:unnamed protein product [Rotaria sp. Silwood1]CAF0743682.1 unnamed protein product [Rotaria sp. Silwood1]CAF3334565.1 unnamed protein product [Rotaria sp. Silwood1]CAF3355700.1 unnamed protein product [Rotaria sp. Silwood1]CAF4674350.1 unnamed protein product [Rotaria sp. Silwood1]
MAQSTEESYLDKLLRTRYPLTYYLSRQQQFVKVYSTTQTIAAPTPSSESSIIVVHKQKVPLPAPPCFNVPDTLDFNASEYEQNNEMDQSLETEEVVTHEYDETILLKNNNNRINESNSDINKINSSTIKRTSAIQLEFSPYEYNSPLKQAIQNGLNIINK